MDASILFGVIDDMRTENRDQHHAISSRLDAIEREVIKLRIWRAKTMGMAAAVSTLISATAWTLAHAFGG